MTQLIEGYTIGADNQKECKGNDWDAQTFFISNMTRNQDYTITQVKIKCYREGNPPMPITASIRETNWTVDRSGNPVGSDISTGTFGDKLTSNINGEWITIDMTPCTLKAGTLYALVVRITGGDASNNIQWKVDVSLPTYQGGRNAFSADAGATWGNTISWDCLFEVYGIPKILKGTIGTAAISKEYPVTEGLVARTTKQTNPPNLEEEPW
jgi:hypothetical protein